MKSDPWALKMLGVAVLPAPSLCLGATAAETPVLDLVTCKCARAKKGGSAMP